MNNLGNVLRAEGRYAEAERWHRQLLDIQRRVLGPENQITLMSMGNLANALAGEGRYAEAEKVLREARDIQRRVLGPGHPDTALSTYNLGCMSARRADPDEALSLLREAVDHGLLPGYDLGIEKDPDFQSLHGDPRFAALVAHAQERAAAVQKPK